MGKRKTRSDNKKTPPPSDLTQHAPQLDLLSQQRSSKPTENSATHPASFMKGLNSSIKKSTLNQNHGHTPHLLISRPSRATLGCHYSRRNLNITTSDASPSNSKGPRYHKTTLELNRQDNSDAPYSDVEGQIFKKPERIRSSSFCQSGGELRRKECSICNKRLRRHLFVVDDSISTGDLSVVAVLVCGHAFHADCLEQKTIHGERYDPTCPLCVAQML